MKALDSFKQQLKGLFPLATKKGINEIASTLNGDCCSSAPSAPVDSRPYKVYTALLTQTGTDAPVANVLENTFNEIFTWTRDGVGIYTVNKLTGFPTNTAIYCITDHLNSIFNNANVVSNAILLNVYELVAGADNSLYNTFIEIRVYN